MRLSTSTNILNDRMNGEPPITQLDSIRLCAQAGYRVMDFCFLDALTNKTPFTGAKWEKYLDDIAQTAMKNKIIFNQGHAVIYDFCCQNIDHEFMQKMMKRCIIGARRLNIPLLVIHPSTDYSTANIYRVSKEKNVSYISRLVEYAKKYNIKLAIENMWDLNISPKRRFASTAEELVDLVDSIGEIGICWDVEHASIEKQNQAQSLRIIGPRLMAAHISDQTGLDNIHILPYLGVSDWDEIIKTLAEIHYKGDLTFEIHRFLTRMPKELILPSLQYSISIGTYMVNQFDYYKNRLCKLNR